MDSKSQQGNVDEDYAVFVDGGPSIAFEEIANNNQTRILSIDFDNGTEQIEILGTQIVPEFGTGSMTATIAILLAVAIIVSLVANTRYKKIRFVPKG